MPKLILVRHGESEWNQENRFTGWYDSDLSAKGNQEAQKAGQLLKQQSLHFDRVHTSLLKRAIRTLWHIQDQTDRMWVPVNRHWRLNERHYGALQGLNKAETAAKHGEDQVLIWRRSFDTPPPPLPTDDERHPCHDPRYQHLDSRVLPQSESLKDTIARVLPYWHDAIVSDLQQGHCVLVVAHGNSLRALVKYLDGMDDQAIMKLNIPTGVPLVYELDNQLRTLNRGYLGDADDIARREAAVANQGKSNG